MKALPKAALGIGSVLPTVLFVGTCVGAVVAILAGMPMAPTAGYRGRAALFDEHLEYVFVGIVAASVVIAIIQLFVGALLAMHVLSRPERSSTERVLWVLGFFLIGHLVLAVYFFMRVYPEPPDVPFLRPSNAVA